MCYTTTEHFKNNVKRTVMQWSLYEKLVRECRGKVPALRLSWRGESTLHPRFVDAVKLAKELGYKEISFLSNGVKFSEEYLRDLIGAGVDSITISIDGLDDEYDRIRAPLNTDFILNVLNTIVALKKEMGVTKPLIKVQGIWPAIRKDPQKYYSTLYPLTDLVAFNPLIDYLDQDDLSEVVYEQGFRCPQLYQRLFVASDGKVMMCNSDEYGAHPVGDAMNETIQEIWCGSLLNSYRNIHKMSDGFKSIDICAKCFYPRATEISEICDVEGRVVAIENYINRDQSVGSSSRARRVGEDLIRIQNL